MLQSIIKPKFFVYVTQNLLIAPNTVVTPQINISNDSDFEVFEIRAIVFPTDQQTAGVTLFISLASGELFSNAPVEIMSFASLQDGGVLHQDVSGYPIRLPINTIIPANSVLNCQLQNNDPAQSVICQVQFFGYKVEKQN